MIALDTNVFIYLLDGDALYQQAATQALKKAAAEGGCAATLVYTECLTGLLGVKHAQALKMLDSFFGSFLLVPLNADIAKTAAKLRTTHGKKLTTADAIHLASALYAKATVFITNDQDLTKLNLKSIKIQGLI